MKKALLVIAAICLGFVLFQYFGQDGELRGRVTIGPASVMEEVSITQMKDGVTRFTMAAREAVMVNQTDVALTAVTITFPEKGLKLTSKTGLFNTENRNLRLDGDIKAVSDDYDIVASTLYFDAAKNSLYSSDKVAILGKRFHVEGRQLDATGEEATLTNNVKAVFSGK